MLKKVSKIFLTFLSLVSMNFAISNFTHTKFIDFAFAVGLIGCGAIWFFTSKGGITSSYTDSISQAQTTNFKMKKEKFSFTPNIPFYTALIYTVVSAVITYIYYKDYF